MEEDDRHIKLLTQWHEENEVIFYEHTTPIATGRELYEGLCVVGALL